MRKRFIHIGCFNLIALILIAIGYVLSDNMVPLPLYALIDYFLGAIFLLIFITWH